MTVKGFSEDPGQKHAEMSSLEAGGGGREATDVFRLRGAELDDCAGG